MKLRTMLRESAPIGNNMDDIVHEAQEAYNDGDYHKCDLLLQLYDAKLAAGERPALPGR
jgi:hypothetical protein